VYYLIEDWQTSHHMEFSGLQIMTAKSQIQVHNRFNLKETKKLSESIDFLAIMTDVIKKRLTSTDLHVIPTRYLSRSSYLPLRAHLRASDPDTVWHTSFQAYQDINNKSASTTLRDKWARMLLCIRGMSAERASAVIDQFETPRDMWTALKERVKEAQQAESQSQSLPEASLEESLGKVKKGKSKVRGPELFFADRIQGEGRRKIGDALSREVRVLAVALWRTQLMCRCTRYSWVAWGRVLYECYGRFFLVSVLRLALLGPYAYDLDEQSNVKLHTAQERMMVKCHIECAERVYSRSVREQSWCRPCPKLLPFLPIIVSS
jgi:hypothetical protein